MHVAELLSGWYVPLGHASQPEAPLEAVKNPAWHAVHPAASADEYIPGRHTVQYETPREPWYMPGEQEVQKVAPVSFWKKPAEHTTQLLSIESFGDTDESPLRPAGHAAHAEAPGAAL